MIRRLFKFFIILPLLATVWAYSNSIGVTDSLSRATGIDIPDAVTIPGIDRIFEARESADQFANEAKRQARLRAMKEVRQEVRKRYGADVAALVPADLTLDEAKRVTKALASGVSLPEIKDLLKDLAPQPGDPTPDDVPGGNGGPSVSVNGGPKMFNTARTQLADLTVKGRAPKTGYDRGEFGSEWSDSAGNFPYTNNGCDTRNDILKRDLVKVKYEPGSTCEVVSGVVAYERYTGVKSRPFDKSKGSSGEYALDIEHMVPLSWAWQHGAQQWSEDKRAAFANAPVNIFAADASANRQKSDSGPGAWLPSNKPYRCAYVSHFVRVLTTFDLYINSADKAAVARVLDGCPS